MLAAILKATVEKSGVDSKKIGDVVVGNVLQGGAGALTSRIAGFLADIPEDVPLQAINRQCSSGLQAVASIAGGIQAGYYDIGMAAGVESMTTNSMMDSVPKEMNPAVFENDKAQECLIPMGNTSENVASKYGITREQQDALACASHAKAVAAQKNGWFDAEIVPVKTISLDKDGEEKEIVVSKDDGVRPTTTMESLAKMRPAFDEDGTTTAGNSSQVSDGARCFGGKQSGSQEGRPANPGHIQGLLSCGLPPRCHGHRTCCGHSCCAQAGWEVHLGC